MILYPAIDIRGGQAVRLLEGDYARETIYDADPVDAASAGPSEGAEFLHVVDLDGAKAGEPRNLDASSASPPQSTARSRSAAACATRAGAAALDAGPSGW